MNAENKNTIMHHDEAVSAKLQRLVNSEAYQYQRQRMLDMLDMPSGPIAVCDFGCGEGSFSRDLKRNIPQGSLLIGLDISPAVLNIAKQREIGSSKPVHYILGDASEPPFPEDSLDMIVFAGTLKYLQTEEAETAALEKQLRTLRPGGQFLVVDGDDVGITYKGPDPELSRKVVNAYAALQGDPFAGSRIEGLLRRVGLNEIRKERIVLEETAFTPSHAGQAMAQNMRDVLKQKAFSDPDKALVTIQELNEFYSQLEESAKNGTYQWKYPKIAVIGKK